MSESAFGVEHGDISKAMRYPGCDTSKLTRLQPIKGMKSSKGKKGKTVPPQGVSKAFGMTSALKPFKAIGARTGKAVDNAGQHALAGGTMNFLSAPKPGGFQSKLGQGQMKLGQGMMRAGSAMQKRPGMTGGAIAGGGAALGAGAFGANRKRP